MSVARTPFPAALPGLVSLVLALGVHAGCAVADGQVQIPTDDDFAGDDDVTAVDDDTTAGDDDTTAGDDDATAGDDDTTAGDDDTTAGDDDTTPDTSKWDGANLHVLSPEPGDFIPLGTAVHLEAEVVDEDGTPMDFDEIAWSTDLDPGWSYTGSEGDVADFPVGQHTVLAQAILPNGDRLTYAVGGVLVQHELAGVYSGTFGLGLSFEYNGTPLSASCLGSTNFVVDAWGEAVEGDSSCTISILGFSQEIAFGVHGEIEPETWHVVGEFGIEILLWEIPVTYEADFTDGPVFTGGFSTDLAGFTIDGTIEADRIALTPG